MITRQAFGPRPLPLLRLQATLSAREGELESARRAAREAATARDAAKVRLAEAEAVLAANRARREQERTELRERVGRSLHGQNTKDRKSWATESEQAPQAL